MRNRDVSGYRQRHGMPLEAAKTLQVKILVETQRVSELEVAHMRELEEQVKAAEAVAKAQEGLEVARARLAQIERRRGKL